MQEDLLQKWLTVEELMILAADLKLSNSISSEKKKETVSWSMYIVGVYFYNLSWDWPDYYA